MSQRFLQREAGPNAPGRRRFLKVIGLSGAGFMVGSLVGHPGLLQASVDNPEALAELGPFIRIGSDNTVTVLIKHLDKGQGVTTGLPTIVAEELDADWTQMRAEFAPADATRYNNLFFGPLQATGGSTSIANSWMQLREAAASARAMLVGADLNRAWLDEADLRLATLHGVDLSGATLSNADLGGSYLASSLSLIHISEPTRPAPLSRMPSSA